jgi:hypothetical protein
VQYSRKVKKDIPLHKFGFHVHYRHDRNVTKNTTFAMSNHLSACISAAPTGQTVVKSDTGIFTKICRKVPNLVKIAVKLGTLN